MSQAMPARCDSPRLHRPSERCQLRERMAPTINTLAGDPRQTEQKFGGPTGGKKRRQKSYGDQITLMIPIRLLYLRQVDRDKFGGLRVQVKAGKIPGNSLRAQNQRYCGRRMLISSVDLIDQVLPYYAQKNPPS